MACAWLGSRGQGLGSGLTATLSKLSNILGARLTCQNFLIDKVQGLRGQRVRRQRVRGQGVRVQGFRGQGVRDQEARVQVVRGQGVRGQGVRGPRGQGPWRAGQLQLWKALGTKVLTDIYQ